MLVELCRLQIHRLSVRFSPSESTQGFQYVTAGHDCAYEAPAHFWYSCGSSLLRRMYQLAQAS